MKGKPFLSKTQSKIDRVLTLGQSLHIQQSVTSLLHPHGHSYKEILYFL